MQESVWHAEAFYQQFRKDIQEKLKFLAQGFMLWLIQHICMYSIPVDYFITHVVICSFQYILNDAEDVHVYSCCNMFFEINFVRTLRVYRHTVRKQ